MSVLASTTLKAMMLTSRTGLINYLSIQNLKSKIRNPSLGLTLIELSVVLSIMVILSLMIIPSLRGFYTGLSSRRIIRQLASTINYTRSQAISSKRIYRLNFDPDGYWLSIQEDPIESPDTYIPVVTPLGRKILLPEGTTFKKLSPPYLTFHPSGRVEGDPIYLEDKTGKYKVTINPIGRIRVE